MPTKFTRGDLAREAWLEASNRERIYARLVRAGKMDPERAARKIAVMQAIAEHFSGTIEVNPRWS